MKIEQVFTSVAYPQGNEQVKVTNKTIVQALKTLFDSARGKLMAELLSVLWSYRTTTRSETGETPYNMVYGTEAVLPAEIEQESARIIAYGPTNKELRAMDLDLVEENRERAAVTLAAYRKRMTRAYNKKVIGKAGVAAYYLEDAEGKKGKRPWNAQHLKKYYS
ncbi:uncharacterized protein [Henckelia pumila]|uniref:uncharacterized protein n=1 Tax=Henckelia pumila TaxID=405737 RepID=UPI003C6E9B45